MRIKNTTGKTLKNYFHLPGWDPREDTLKPGETSDEWLHLDEGIFLKLEK